MSFELLKEQVIDVGLCQGCGLCAGSCKHIDMVNLRPELKDYCILERGAVDCGMCYEKCPQVRQELFHKQQPKAIYSLRSKNPEILKNAASGGFMTTISKYLLEEKELSEVITVKNVDDNPEAVAVSKPEDMIDKGGVVYGRSGVLKRLVDEIDKIDEKLGIIGVPCEIRGAAELEERMQRDILKMGLFCKASIRNELTEHGKICSPCCSGCPAGVNAQGYISLIREGKYQEAVELIRENNPLPSVCGRICTHECEFGCTLIGEDHPVAIKELKKYVTEWEIENREITQESIPKKDGEKIAIIGSGPAGLTAAYYLANEGYRPTIFEKSDKVGGMLRFGVPQFRLPNYVLDHDVEMIKQAGVEIKTNSPLGPDLTIQDLKDQGFEAIFIATGQYKPKTLKLEGEDLPGVHVAIDFLIDRKYRYWDRQEEYEGKTLGVIGGGPVAVDVAQTALRLGAEEVHLVDIATEEDLKLVLREIPETEMEFMNYHFKTSTSKITKDEDDNLVLNCYKIKWGEPEENGRKSLDKVEESEFKIPVDEIVIAIGQSVDFSLINEATDQQIDKERGHIVIDDVTFETNIPGVFAGGDIVANSKAVAVAAIGHGREAAISIDRYLKGEDLKEGRYRKDKTFFSGPREPPKDFSPKPESKQTMESQTQEMNWNFEEIEGMFNEDMALREARRCLSCNNFCSHCQDFPAIYSDFTAGEAGSEEGFTTVVVWTDRGKKIIEKAITEGLFEVGEVNEEELNEEIELKTTRQLTDFPRTSRQKILTYIAHQGPTTIRELSKELSIDPKEIRHMALKLLDQRKLKMNLEAQMGEPTFQI
jgi:NADPH-dependent glutamate synthase beta subunit-like oxidoreductase